MKVLLFRTDYDKLNKRRFTTIRQHGHNLELNSICHVKTPTQEFNAKVLNRFHIPLNMVPEKVLLEDTGTHSREEAYKILESCWNHKVSSDQDIVLVNLGKVEGEIKQRKYKKTYQSSQNLLKKS